MYYLDNAATTRPYPEVIEKVQQCLGDDFGNPSSVHPVGIQAKMLVDESRKTLAKLFDVPLAGITFCSGGTESDNLALKGILQNDTKFRGRLVSTRLEHAAVLQTTEWLEQWGVGIDFVNIDKKTGQIDLEHLEKLIVPETRLVSVQHVNSETGIIQNLEKISRIIKEKNPSVLFHSDGVQAFCKIPVNLKALGVDLYSISGHKFHGIKGAGALILPRKINLRTILHGGGQELGIRSGTENIPGIAAMGIAAKLSHKQLIANLEKVEEFSSLLKKALIKDIKQICIFHPPETVPHIISFSIPGIPGEVLLNHLVEKNIFISTGSACNANKSRISPALQALGYSQQKIRETVRISIAANEIPSDWNLFFNEVTEVIRKLQEMIGC